MPKYEYKAKNIDGKRVKGHIQAVDEDQAYLRIRNAELYATSIKEMKNKVRTKPLKSRHLADFSKQIGSMLNSGIPLVQAMNILQQREENEGLKQVYIRIYQQLIRGNVLSYVLEEQEGLFPSMMINMFRAGEASGQLGTSAMKLADYYEKDNKLKKRIAGALIYPVFLFIMMIAVVIVIFTMILPTFFDLFESMDSLPGSTKFLIAVSRAMTDYAAIFLIGLISVILIGIYLSQTMVCRSVLDRLKVKLPGIRGLMKTIYTARFARTLTSLYSNGLPLVNAIRISAAIIENLFIEKQFDQVIEDVCNGVSLSTALSAVAGFDARLVTSIYIGEEAGRLDTMLTNIADSFDFEAEEASRRLTTLIEPVMIVIMAVMVGYIMLSVMVPIFQYYQSLG